MLEAKKVRLDFSDAALEDTLVEALSKFTDYYTLIDKAENFADVYLSDQLDVLTAQQKTSARLYLCDQPEKELPEDLYVITLPLRLGEVLKQLDIILFGETAQKRINIKIGNYVFKAHEKQLVPEKETLENVALTDKEVEILTFLYQQKNHITSRETLLEKVWKYNSQVTTHTLETHIYRLRQKIEQDPSEARYLVTVEGKGYQLVLD